MRWMRRLALLLLLSFAPLLLTGCWDVRDVNDRTPALAMGFDYSPNTGWTVSLSEALLNPGGNAAYTNAMHSGQGSTVIEAIEDLRSHLARRLYLGSARVFVLGQGAIQSQTYTVMRLLGQRSEVDETAFLVGAKGTAEGLLSQPDGAFGMTAVRLLKEFEGLHQARDGHVTERIWEAERDMLTPGQGSFIVLPLFVQLPQTSVMSAGTAVIGPDGQLKTVLSREQGVALRWVMRNSGRNVLVLADGSAVKTAWVREATRVPDPRHLEIRLRLAVEGYDFPTHIITANLRARIARLTAQEVLGRTVQVVHLLQAAGVDPAGWTVTARAAGVQGFDVRQAQAVVHVYATVQPHLAPSM